MLALRKHFYENFEIKRAFLHQTIPNKAYQAYWHLSLQFSGRDSISRGYISAILIYYKNFELFLGGFRWTGTNKTY